MSSPTQASHTHLPNFQGRRNIFCRMRMMLIYYQSLLMPFRHHVHHTRPIFKGDDLLLANLRGEYVNHLWVFMLIMIFHTSNDKVDYCEDNDGDNYQALHTFNKLSMKVTVWRITSCWRRLLATLNIFNGSRYINWVHHFVFKQLFPFRNSNPLPLVNHFSLFSFASNYLEKIVAMKGSKNINLETTKVKVASGHLSTVHWVKWTILGQ